MLIRVNSTKMEARIRASGHRHSFQGFAAQGAEKWVGELVRELEACSAEAPGPGPTPLRGLSGIMPPVRLCDPLRFACCWTQKDTKDTC